MADRQIMFRHSLYDATTALLVLLFQKGHSHHMNLTTQPRIF